MSLLLDDYFKELFDYSFLAGVSQQFFSFSNFKNIYAWDIPKQSEKYSLLDLAISLRKNVPRDSSPENPLEELIYAFTKVLFPSDRYNLFIASSVANKKLSNDELSKLFTVEDIGSALANLCFTNLFGTLQISDVNFPDIWKKKKKIFFQYPCSLAPLLLQMKEKNSDFYNDFYGFDEVYGEYKDAVIDWGESVENNFKVLTTFSNKDGFLSGNIVTAIQQFQDSIPNSEKHLTKIYCSLRIDFQEHYKSKNINWDFHKRNIEYVLSVQEEKNKKFFTQLNELLSLFIETIRKESSNNENMVLCYDSFINILHQHISTFSFQLCDIFQEYQSNSYGPTMEKHFSDFFSYFLRYELLEVYLEDFYRLSDKNSLIIKEIYSFRKRKGFNKEEKNYSVDEQELLSTLFKNVLQNLQNKPIPLPLQLENKKFISDQIEDRFEVADINTKILEKSAEVKDSLIAAYFPYLLFSYVSQPFSGTDLSFSFKERMKNSDNKNVYKSYRKCLIEAFSIENSRRKTTAYSISELEYKIFLFSCCIETCFETLKKYAIKIDIDYQASCALFLWNISAYVPDFEKSSEIPILKNSTSVLGYDGDSFEIGSLQLFQYTIHRLFEADLSAFCKTY